MTVKAAKYPLATTTWDGEEYGALDRVIKSGHFTMGAEVAAFESEFADYFGSQYAVMVNSGSSANLIALAAAVISPDIDLSAGDEVIVPAVSWATTYYPVHQLGLKLRFVDIDLDTLNLDVSKIAEAITTKTKAILAVSLLGNPCDFAALRELCRVHGLTLIEDNCESMGAQLDGKYTGTFGAVGTFSTFFSHHMSTMEGGLIVTDDRYLAEAMMSLRAHGWTRQLGADNLIHPKTDNPFDDLFRFVLPGYNVRPLEMSGAIGREQLKKLPEFVRARQQNGAAFREAFTGRDDVRIQKEIGKSSWFGFSLILEGRLAGRRAEVADALTAAGVESRPIVGGNFVKNPVMRYLDATVPPTLPAAEKLDVDGLFVGNHHYPIEAELQLLVDVFDGMAR